MTNLPPFLSNAVWRIPPLPKEWSRLQQSLGIDPVVAQILARRGFHEPREALAFLDPDRAPVPSPFLLPDMESAAARLHQAIQARERVLVYGDYDVDGVTATVLLVRQLRVLGVPTDYYIPRRLDEGYGVHAAPLTEAARRGISLVITVDTGIGAHEAARQAAELGLDLIITDHHLPGAELPTALAVIDPHRSDAAYPFDGLTGAGLALKLLAALEEVLGRELIGAADYALASLGTIADVAPLLSENRKLVRQGLAALRERPLPGIGALLDVAELAGDELTSQAAAFLLAPRINAVGRIGDPDQAVRLLLTDSESEAASLAEELNRNNLARRQMESEILAQAEEQAEREGRLADRVILLADEAWHPGVVGIVAARLTQAWHRPVLLGCLDGDRCSGSGRSIAGFNLVESLTHNREGLETFGGHRQAAGFRLKRENLDTLREGLNRYAGGQPDEVWIPKIDVDAEIDATAVSNDLVATLDTLQPFGPGNPRPVLLFHKARVQGSRTVGKAGRHLKLWLAPESGTARLDAIAFGFGSRADHLQPGLELEVVGQPEFNTWQGQTRLQIKVKDLMAANSALGGFWRKWVQAQEEILRQRHPAREVLAPAYVGLKGLAQRNGAILPSQGELRSQLAGEGLAMPAETLDAALQIFSELGLLVPMRQGGADRWVFSPPPQERLNLEASARYRQGLEEWRAFHELRRSIANGAHEEAEARLRRFRVPSAKSPSMEPSA